MAFQYPDAATFQQAAISRAGPGHRLPDGTNPLIVLKNKQPILASAAIGVALQEVTLQNLINVLDLRMDPETAAKQPDFLGPLIELRNNASPRAQLSKEVLDPGFQNLIIEALKSRGQDLYLRPSGQEQSGYWIAIKIDPKRKRLYGGATRKLNSWVEGF